MAKIRLSHAIVIGLASCILLGGASLAQAAACRDVATVQASANPDKNTAAGGHVTIHIKGMTPPKGSSQMDKTMFPNKDAFNAAWAKYAALSVDKFKPINCGTDKAPFQVLTIEKLGIADFTSYSCTAVNDKGECTASKEIDTEQVSFGFLLNGKTWILNTMYPVGTPKKQ